MRKRVAVLYGRYTWRFSLPNGITLKISSHTSFKDSVAFDSPVSSQMTTTNSHPISNYDDMTQSRFTGSCGAHQHASTSGSSPFLSLPAELRVEIYRSILVSSGPVVLPSDGITSFRSCDGNPRGVALLRTCTQIYTETTNVLYGENQFRFISGRMACSSLLCLPRSSFRHLKELTIPTPFHGCIGRPPFRRQHSSNVSNYDLQPDSINPDLCRTDFPSNHAIRQLLNAIANAPQLHQLNLLLDKRRAYESSYEVSLYASLSGRYHAFINNEDVWEDLAGLLRVKKALRITIVQHHYPVPQFLSTRAKRFLRAMRSRLGVWDVRDIDEYKTDYSWNDYKTIPAAREENNPDEWLRAIRNLFEEKRCHS